MCRGVLWTKERTCEFKTIDMTYSVMLQDKRFQIIFLLRIRSWAHIITINTKLNAYVRRVRKRVIVGNLHTEIGNTRIVQDVVIDTHFFLEMC